MSALRLFIGLPLPDAYQKILQQLRAHWQQQLRSRLTWTRPGNWHITLKFLGDTEEKLVADLQEALARISWQAFPLQGGAGGFFPPPKPGKPPRPRVVWAGLRQGAQETTALAAAVDAALTPLGVPPEERPFRPHLTLARVKFADFDDAKDGGGTGPAATGWAGLLAALHNLDWPVCSMTAFTLWQSRLEPSGPVYAPLATFQARG